jgi:hypothetical protein
MIRRLPSLLILFQLLLLLPISHVDGFANYLLSRSQCFTELSTGEAIMNAMVVAASDSVDPSMRIELVKDEAEDSLPITNESNDPFYTVVVVKTLPLSLAFRVVSSAIPKNDDYQWVMDVLVPAVADSTSSASFLQGGCDGKWRTTGRGPQDAVTLTVNAWGNMTLLAAWALSYGPVTLTQPLTISILSTGSTALEVVTPKQPRMRGASSKNQRNEEESPEPGTIGWMLVGLLLLLAILLAGAWWWYRIRPRYMKGQRWHL